MALADYFLPACTYAERNGLRVGDGAQRAETINKAIEPLGESRSDMQICLDIGKRISPEAWPWDTVEDMYSNILAETGHTFEEMQELAPGYPPFEYHMHEKGLLRADGNVGFDTATGRIELWCSMYNNLGLDPLPSYEEPVPSPLSTPELCEEYPLVLTTGARLWGMFHSEHRQIPRMRALHPEPLVYVNPKTAADFGVKDGDWVWVENHRGRCQARGEGNAHRERADGEHRPCVVAPRGSGRARSGPVRPVGPHGGEPLPTTAARPGSARTTRTRFARSTAWRKESSDGCEGTARRL